VTTEPLGQPRGRVIGLDLGARRIGVAVSDDGGRLATGHGLIERSGDPAADHREVARLVSALDATVVVVGLPLSLSGAVGPAAAAVRAEVDMLRSMMAVPVETHDERFTTVTAAQGLRAGGGGRRARRRRVDEVAAAVMLQSWLDSRRPAEDRPPRVAGPT
jgi:putative Holliday junction resolvase